MGFSVSGSAVVILMGLMIGVSTYYAATTNAMERITDARDDHREHVAEVQATNVDITSAEFEDGPDELRVTVNNTGEVALWLGETDLLVNNSYQTGWRTSASLFTGTSTVTGTSLWQPGEELTITVQWDNEAIGGQPERVQVATAVGVADATEVTQV